MQVTKFSMLSGKINTLELNVTKQQLELYEQGGGNAQDIFKDLSPEEREFIITGVTQEEWNEVFPDPLD
jgi:hypothetical protein